MKNIMKILEKLKYSIEQKIWFSIEIQRKEFVAENSEIKEY